MTVNAGVSEIFQPVLDRLAVDAARYYGVPAVSFVTTDSQDRLYSYLMRVAVRQPGAERLLSHLFVKVYKRKEIPGGPNAMRDRVAADFESTRHASEIMAPHGDVGTVPPVACYPDLLAIVTEQIEGQTLLEHLQAQATWFPSAATMDRLCATMERVGRWIRVYQSTRAAGPAVEIGELRQYVDHRLGILRSHEGISIDERAEMLQAIDVLAEDVDLDALAAVPIHADLALGNVLISGPRVVVLDFAMAKSGTCLHDLTRLFVQMDLLTVKPYFRRDVIGRLQQALLTGFDPRLTAADPLFRILTLLHRTNHLTTLVVNRASGAEAVYNGLIRRRHRRWIASEVAAARRALEPA